MKDDTIIPCCIDEMIAIHESRKDFIVIVIIIVIFVLNVYDGSEIDLALFVISKRTIQF